MLMSTPKFREFAELYHDLDLEYTKSYVVGLGVSKVGGKDGIIILISELIYISPLFKVMKSNLTGNPYDSTSISIGL